jgi:hypothetical protein
MVEFARRIERETGYELYWLGDNVMAAPGVKRLWGYSPPEFLGLIKNAEIVLTTSFHGTAFSILFHKNFVAALEAPGRHNDRIENLLKTFGLEDRALECCEGKDGRGFGD